MPKKTLLRFAHLSDLHFSTPSWNPLQLFSKRWIGNLNLLLRRKREFNEAQLYQLLPLLQQRNVTTVLLTGDLTSTSHPKEFALASDYVDALKNAGLRTFLLPGNHDHYTKAADQQRVFYRYFDSEYNTPYRLKENRITTTELGHNWWLFAIDTTLATSLLTCHGHFFKELEETLRKALQSIPEGHQVILMNHFPFFELTSKKKNLLRGEALQELLTQFPQVKFYLHGHTHRHTIADLRPSGLPIILDSGCSANKEDGSFNLVEIHTEGCDVEVFRINDHTWQSVKQVNLKW